MRAWQAIVIARFSGIEPAPPAGSGASGPQQASSKRRMYACELSIVLIRLHRMHSQRAADDERMKQFFLCGMGKKSSPSSSTTYHGSCAQTRRSCSPENGTHMIGQPQRKFAASDWSATTTQVKYSSWLRSYNQTDKDGALPASLLRAATNSRALHRW